MQCTADLNTLSYIMRYTSVHLSKAKLTAKLLEDLLNFRMSESTVQVFGWYGFKTFAEAFTKCIISLVRCCLVRKLSA